MLNLLGFLDLVCLRASRSTSIKHFHHAMVVQYGMNLLAVLRTFIDYVSQV